MYKQLTKSNNATVSVDGVCKPNTQFEQAKKEDIRAQDAKKGWQTVSDDFGGSYSGRSPGSASQTMRKDVNDVTKKEQNDVTLKRNNL